MFSCFAVNAVFPVRRFVAWPSHPTSVVLAAREHTRRAVLHQGDSLAGRRSGAPFGSRAGAVHGIACGVHFDLPVGWCTRTSAVAPVAAPETRHEWGTPSQVDGTPREMNLMTWSGRWPGQNACIAHVPPASSRSANVTPGWAANATSNPSREPRRRRICSTI